MAKRVIILGATGSIGSQALECLDGMKLVGFSYYRNQKIAKHIKMKFPDAVAYSQIYEKNGYVDIFDFIKQLKPDLVLNAIASWDGLLVTKFCVENQIPIALANKESLVIAGSFLLKIAQQTNTPVIPVDSEHTTLAELMSIDPDNVKTIYITASGGKYFNWPDNELAKITFEQASHHPVWRMGERITIDSNSLVNKCYELIEAYHLFGNKVEIKAIQHSKSMVHSIVQFKNNSYLFNVSQPDMKLAIRLALTNFCRSDCVINPLDFDNLTLTFKEIDSKKYLPIQWFEKFKASGNLVIGPVINITNEWCFDKFLWRKIKFTQIWELIDETINAFWDYPINKFDDLFQLKEKVLEYLNNKGI